MSLHLSKRRGSNDNDALEGGQKISADWLDKTIKKDISRISRGSARPQEGEEDGSESSDAQSDS